MLLMKTSILQHPVKKVMLVFPPVMGHHFYDKMCCIPMGIAYLGAVLRNHYDVRLLDAVVEGYHLERSLAPNVFQYGLDTDMIMERICEFGPDVIGVSCLFSNQFQVVSELVQKVKSWNADVITVIGGTHPTFLPERCLREEALDYIVMGEAEESLPALLQAIEKGNGHEQIDGLAYRTIERNVIHPKTTWIKDIDSLPFPARDLLPLEKYFTINVPMSFISRRPRNVSFISSRGCPFHCRFCSSATYWGNRYRPRSPENVLAELEHLKSAYGIEEIKFEDDNLTLDIQRAKTIFRGMIERKLNFSWNMPNGAMIKTLADRELVQLMKQSGCYEITLAVESGDQWVLDNIIKKPLNLDDASRIAQGIRKEGIDLHAYFIVGLPGETLANINNTFRYAHSLNLDRVHVFFYNPLPGTSLYQESLERGFIRNEYQTEENINYATSVISGQDWTAELLEKIMWREYFRFTYRRLIRNPGKFFGKYFYLNLLNLKKIQAVFHSFLKMIKELIKKSRSMENA
jgi:anaerobic magnesium-protoporphyrin IX monomethyl ester cyclase